MTNQPTIRTARRSTRALLAAGTVAGPLFVVAVLTQELTRSGFDPAIHPLSLLSTGDLGWIQITNFIVSGLLFLAGAVGLRRTLHPGRGGTWGPALVGLLGGSLIWGGVFVADPAFGFPAGTPEGAPEELSWHGALHAIAPSLASLALIVACFVLARRAFGAGQRGWGRTSVTVGVVAPALTLISFAADDFRWMLAGGVLQWVWASLVAARAHPRSAPATGPARRPVPAPAT